MEAVVDSSTLISLASAGILTIVELLPFELVVLDSVYEETVTAGLAGQHPEASAVEAALAGRELRSAPSERPVDLAVLDAAVETGLVLSNDLALGRRARNVGVRWLRTVDLVHLLYELDELSSTEATAAVVALRDSQRITPDLARQHLEGFQ